MASEVLKLTAQIVISHASMSELSPRELVREIKEVYGVLTSLAGEAAALETKAQPSCSWKPVKMAESPEAQAVLDEEKAPFEDQDYLEFMASREG